MKVKETYQLIEHLRELISDNRLDQIAPLLCDVSAADTAKALSGLELEEKTVVLKELLPEKIAKVIAESSILQKKEISSVLPGALMKEILSLMPSDEKADLLVEFPEEKADEILALLSDKEAEEIEKLARYKENTAGSLMTTEYLWLSVDLNAREALLKIQEIVTTTKLIFYRYIYICTSDRKLLGVVSIRNLIAAAPEIPLREIMKKDVVNVSPFRDQEEVARDFEKYNFTAIPVVNDNHKLLGIITADDIIEVIEREATEDILSLAGTYDKAYLDPVHTPILTMARSRLAWLFVCVIGGMLAASVINLFRTTIQEAVTFALFMPIIMATGGNAGVQSSTLLVRSIATGKLEIHNMFSFFLKEIRVGMLMGLIAGILVGLTTIFWHQMPILGLVVGFAIFLTITTGNLLGFLFPLIFKRLNIDPAIAATPLVTTVNDCTNLLIYFLLAGLFLRLFS